MTAILRAKVIRLPGQNADVGTGWLPPIYDRRDYTPTHPQVAPILQKVGLPKKGKKLAAAPLPSRLDLREYFSPVENQLGLGSCTANAGVGIVEYYENRAFQKYLNGSRLFLYKNTRNLMGVTGDTGAWLRNTMGALALCGMPDEKYWPYTDADPDFDREPPAFVYAIADNFEALKYFCHDPLGQNVPYPNVLVSVKEYLVAGIPAVFGFWGYASSSSSNVPGAFPLPGRNEPAEWGHAVVAAGYDDDIEIKNTQYPGVATKGAFLIRNSWGTTWGDQGYGWIPYEYVLRNIAMDFWSLISMAWVDTDQFHFGP